MKDEDVKTEETTEKSQIPKVNALPAFSDTKLFYVKLMIWTTRQTLALVHRSRRFFRQK